MATDLMADVEEEAAEECRTDRGRSRDVELLTLDRIIRHLEDLAPPARQRAVAWLAHRFMGEK